MALQKKGMPHARFFPLVPEHTLPKFTVQACDGQGGITGSGAAPSILCSPCAGMRWSICAKEVCFKNKLLQQFFANGKVRRGS